jgi:TonB family protein
MGASLVVFGQVRSSEQKTTLSVGLIQVVDKKKRSIAETDLFLSQEWRSTFDKPLDWPVSSDVVVPCVGPRRDRVAAAFRAAGVSEAICTHCPSPAYTDRARVAKYHGTVKLAMIIGENGRVRSATIIKGDEYGLDATTALAVKEWQLQPGTRDGKPVAVCTLIETAFGVY